MKRSDLLFMVDKCNGKIGKKTFGKLATEEDMKILINEMHKKIENVYIIIFEMEKNPHFKPSIELLKKAVES